MKFEHTLTMNWENAFRGLRHPLESYSRSDSRFGLTNYYGEEIEEVEDAWMKNKYPELTEKYQSNNISLEEERKFVEEINKINEWLCNEGAIKNDEFEDIYEYAFIGPNDLDLAQRMIKAGTPNDKFLRQIFVSVDITAPLYWWKEMDTYKVGTTANSTSTMHKIASTPITLTCFEIDDLNEWLELNDQPLNYGFENVIKYCEDLRQKFLETKDMRYWKELIRWLPESWLQTRTWTANYSILRNIIHWRKNHKLTEWRSFYNWIKTLPYANELILFEN